MAFDTPLLVDDTVNNADAASYQSDPFTIPAGQVFLVQVVNGKDTAPDVPTVDGCTAIDGAANGLRRNTWFWALGTGEPQTVTADFGEATQTGCIIRIYRLPGADTTSPVVQSKTATGGTDSPTVTLDNSPGDDSLLIGGCSYNNASLFTAGSGFTAFTDSDMTDPIASAVAEWVIDPEDGVVDGGLGQSANWTMVAIEFIAGEDQGIVGQLLSPVTLHEPLVSNETPFTARRKRQRQLAIPPLIQVR